MNQKTADPDGGYRPLFQTIREKVVESVHYGAAAVVNAEGRLLAWAGDPQVVTYLRSSAKPFQALPLVEMGGLEHLSITTRELAVICASHSGTDRHLQAVASLQKKAGLDETHLLCCTHPPFDRASRALLRDRGEVPGPNHHNCSGKHSGVLAQARMRGASLKDYTGVNHPVQQEIRNLIGELCDLPPEKLLIGRDGCSLPTFAMPLYHAALGWARLADPRSLPPERQRACKTITSAMMEEPFYVAGPGRFDTRLMESAPGAVISKAGAEAFQALGIPPDPDQPDSSGLGIVLKISDGDQGKRARRAAVLEILRQLNLITTSQMDELKDLGPDIRLYNQCHLPVGIGRPCFTLQRS